MKRENLITLCAKVANEVEKVVNSYNGKYSLFCYYSINDLDSFMVLVQDVRKEEDNVVYNKTLYSPWEWEMNRLTPKNLRLMKEQAIKTVKEYDSKE